MRAVSPDDTVDLNSLIEAPGDVQKASSSLVRCSTLNGQAKHVSHLSSKRSWNVLASLGLMFLGGFPSSTATAKHVFNNFCTVFHPPANHSAPQPPPPQHGSEPKQARAKQHQA